MEWVKQIGRGLIVLLLQVLLFNHLQIAGWGFPMVYILILINLPAQMPKWVDMLIGFAIGWFMDMWSNSLGVNIAACVAISYLRPITLRHIMQDAERIKGEVRSSNIGMGEYIKCLVILTLIHHFAVFALETWNLAHWWITILQTLLSSIMTLIILIGYDRLRGN